MGGHITLGKSRSVTSAGSAARNAENQSRIHFARTANGLRLTDGITHVVTLTRTETPISKASENFESLTMKNIYERLNDDDRYLDAIDDAIDLIRRMREVIASINVENSSARLENAELWSVNSDFQEKVDRVLGESAE